MPTRMQYMKVHTLVAAFVFPVACMFLITGGLYTWGIKGSYVNDSYEIDLQKPIEAELSTLVLLAATELGKLDIEPPSGTPKIKTAGNHFMLEWTGSTKDIVFEPTDRPLTASLTVKHTSLYRTFVQLHKAKGGQLFKIYAAMLAISLAVLLLSGFVMAWQTPKLKRLASISFILGVTSFIGLVLAS